MSRFVWEIGDLEEMATAGDANPNHHPAGAPGGKGGQFAPKGVGGGTSASFRSPPDMVADEIAWNERNLSPGVARSPSEVLRSAGYDEETIKEVSGLLNGHRVGSLDGVSLADLEIERHFKEGTEIAAALRTRAAFEKKVYSVWAGAVESRIDREIEDLRWSFDEGLVDNWDNDSFEDWYAKSEHKTLHDQMRRDAVDPPLYRGGSLDKVVQPWTTDPRGAHIGALGRIKVDHTSTLGALESDGYEFVGGLIWAMGSPGESEILMVKT